MSEPHVSKEQKYREIISSVVLIFLKRDKACSSPELHDTVTNLTQVFLLFMCIGSCVLFFLLLGTLTIDNLNEINKRKFTLMTLQQPFWPTNKTLSDNWTQYDTRYTACKTSWKIPAESSEKTSLLISTHSYGDQAIQAVMNNPDLVGSYDFILDSRWV